ncbi:MAG: pilus assembly protein N-terminal domain-containing protein [Myxococcota bacterium]|nr:pilus assembly protein N-terminal domain-containing protein [Myxococcota bacterium]
MTLSRKLCLVVMMLVPQLVLAEPVALFPGWPQTINTGPVARTTVGDPSVVEVATSEKGELILTGRKEGTTTVSVWVKNAQAPRVLEVRVETGGWELVPVLVAAIDIQEGSPLTQNMVVTRRVPRFLLTSSVARPDSLNYLLNAKTHVPIQAGDFLLWSAFESMRR